MGEFIDKDALIGDDYRAAILCEYTHDLSLIKQLIGIAEKAISLKDCPNNYRKQCVLGYYAML